MTKPNEAPSDEQEFKREERYIVTKIKTGKRVECVVIESDWPEYEPVWQMLKDRMEGKPSQRDKDAATIELLCKVRADDIAAMNRQADTIAQLKEEVVYHKGRCAARNLLELQAQLSASQEHVNVLREALEYHQLQTRPIQRSIEALAATAPAESDIDQATRYR